MKNLIKLFTIVFICGSFFSCEKEDETHRIKYTIEYLEKYEYAPTNHVSLVTRPCYEEDRSLTPTFDQDLWEVEYGGLMKGDDVYFLISVYYPGYRCKISIHIDDELVSYKDIYYGDYGFTTIDEFGLDDKEGDDAISFKY